MALEVPAGAAECGHGHPLALEQRAPPVERAGDRATGRQPRRQPAALPAAAEGKRADPRRSGRRTGVDQNAPKYTIYYQNALKYTM